MLVSELFTRLSYGELSNLAISGDGSGTIIPAKQPKLIQYTNEALLRLYSRFVLKQDDLVLELAEHILFYRLEKRFATSNQNPVDGDVLYIRDTVHKPFQGDVIRILMAVDIQGEEIPLNDHEHPQSVFTPQPHVLQIPRPVDMEPVGVLYQARHVPLMGLTDHIDLPATLEKAAQAYVAHLVYSHMNGQEPAAKAAEHLRTYDTICMEVEAKDLVSTSISNSNSKFDKRGFA